MRYRDWPAVLYLTNPRSGSMKYLCRVCGLGLPGAEITLRIDSGRIARTMVEENGRWCFEKELLPILKKGDHSIKVVHSDGIGANENAYANITITDDPGNAAARDTYCEAYNPINKFFHFAMRRPDPGECFTQEDFADDNKLLIAGWFVNNNNLEMHRLKFKFTNYNYPIEPLEWTEDIITSGKTYDQWFSTRTDSWNAGILNYINNMQSGVKETFCLEVWDLNTGAYDDYCFCVTKTT
jgi:hypothetical protein